MCCVPDLEQKRDKKIRNFFFVKLFTEMYKNGKFGAENVVITLLLNFGRKNIAKKREKMVNMYAVTYKKSQKRKIIVQNITKQRAIFYGTL